MKVYDEYGEYVEEHRTPILNDFENIE